MLGQPKLTPEQVIAIREDDRREAVIARQYGVTRQAIYKVRSGYSYKHVGGPRVTRRAYRRADGCRMGAA